MKELAAKLGFVYVGEALPKSLELSGTPIAGQTKAWNVIDGEVGGVRIIVFDCRIGSGKGSWQRTVVAARTPPSGSKQYFRDPSLLSERSGAWLITYRHRAVSLVPRGLIPVEELERHLSTFQKITWC